jgi:hypothetical protein
MLYEDLPLTYCIRYKCKTRGTLCIYGLTNMLKFEVNAKSVSFFIIF